jgi:predicted kinase
MPEERDFDVGAAVAAAKCLLTVRSPAAGQPVLVMLSGLPGTGKTTLALRLAEAMPAVMIESDRLRQLLFAPPTYSPEESRRVHLVCHILIGWFLRQYYHTIYDATNLYEYQRRQVYRLAERSGARLLVVQLTASEEVIRERLAPRRPGPPAEGGPLAYSDADWAVYQRMRRQAEPIQHEHLALDTSRAGIQQLLERVLDAARRG